MKRLKIEDKIFKKSLGTIQIGVDDGMFNLAVFDDRARSSLKPGEHPIDIGRIERRLNVRFGDSVHFVIGSAISEQFASAANTEKRGIIVQSFSNEYIKEYPERFALKGVQLEEIDTDTWHDNILDMARYMCTLLKQDSAIVFFEDLPSGGDVLEMTVHAEDSTD